MIKFVYFNDNKNFQWESNMCPWLSCFEPNQYAQARSNIYSKGFFMYRGNNNKQVYHSSNLYKMKLNPNIITIIPEDT